ncbi:MAG: trehalose-phosphatase [Candidatus Planktophila sp.]|nr:trehalose-phosphatase [Candidatus Planktophila sp.]
MKDADIHMDSILADIRNRGCVLMLDFDGVLSPIVEIPSEARISPDARRSLIACAKKMPVAVITGRPLLDIEVRIGLTEIIYAGSHGVEWKMDGQTHRHGFSQNSLSVFEMARSPLLHYAKLFPELFIEDNNYGLTFGYRLLSATQAAQFRIGATEIAEKFVSAGGIRLIDNLFTFEITPMSEWTKGSCARHIYYATRKGNALPVYIGDSLSDEDVFRVFAKSGVTFRVGQSNTSLAQYYFKSRSQVDRFLHNISIETNQEMYKDI